jgi:hypothetical protein
MLVFDTNPGSADISKADEVYSGSAFNGTYYHNTTSGIPAKEMGDNRYYAAYAKLTDGSTVYSPLYQYSPKKYATNKLANSTDTKLKALCVAMLNYGAAAQEYFGYKTGSLMNADLTAAQKSLVVAYNSGYFAGAVAADESKTANFTRTSTGFKSRSASVSFDGAFAINYYFTPNVTVKGNMTLYIWDPATYASVGTLTAANATSAVTMTPGTDGSYWAQASGIPAKGLDKTYYVAGVYRDATGNRYCTGVIAYSLSKYCINNANGNMGALAQATAMYGYYAANYFVK